MAVISSAGSPYLLDGNPLEAPEPGRSVVMTGRCLCVQGVRSARNEYRHPGENGSPQQRQTIHVPELRPRDDSPVRTLHTPVTDIIENRFGHHGEGSWLTTRNFRLGVP